MGVLRDLRGPLVGLGIATFLFVVTAIVGVFNLLAMVLSGTTLSALVWTAMPFVISLVFFGFCGLATLAWGFSRIATGVVDTEGSVLRDERLASVARMLERHNEWARELDLAEKVTPTDRERAKREIQRLKDEYAAGNLSDGEFERRLEQQIEDAGLDDTQAARERELSGERSS